MALIRCIGGSTASASIIEDDHAVFNNTYVALPPASPLQSGIGFANVKSFSTAVVTLYGAGAYSDIQIYGYDPETHTATHLTSSASVDISSYDYLLFNAGAGTQITFSV